METGNMPEDKFLKKVKEIILAHLEDDSFGVANLAREMGLSRSQLFVSQNHVVIIRPINSSEIFA